MGSPLHFIPCGVAGQINLEAVIRIDVQGKGQSEVDAGEGARNGFRAKDGCCRKDQKWIFEPGMHV